MKNISFISFLLILIISVTSLAQTYYITETGKKYHKQSCRFVKDGGKPIELTDAVSKGYEPCGVCKPKVGAKVDDPNQVNSGKNEDKTVTKENSENSKQEKKQCIAFTKKGKQCKRTAEEGSDYCWQHQK